MVILGLMRREGFGVLELIGVLAILAILSALVVPRVMRVSHPQQVVRIESDGRVFEAVIALQSIQTAAAAHLAQHGCLPCLNGVPLSFAGNYDGFGQVLLSEGLIERPFHLALATNGFLRLHKITGNVAGSTVEGFNGAYSLDGTGRNTVIGGVVLEAVLPGLSESDARALDERIDGTGQRSGVETGDWLGRVIYPAPDAQGRTEVHVYISHQ